MAERFGRPPADPNSPAAVPAARYTDAGDDDEAPPTPATIPARGPGNFPSAGPGTERIDSQVQKAQEQLLNLRRQQELIERQKRELEELSRRQEELESGRNDLLEKLTRALVIVERQSTEAHKRVEQLQATGESFAAHLQSLEGINAKSWASADMQRELSRALGMVDHARTEYNQQKGRLLTEPVDGSTESGETADERYEELFGKAEDHSFLHWLKIGFAFTLPLLVVLLILAFILCWRIVNGAA